MQNTMDWLVNWVTGLRVVNEEKRFVKKRQNARVVAVQTCIDANCVYDQSKRSELPSLVDGHMSVQRLSNRVW